MYAAGNFTSSTLLRFALAILTVLFFFVFVSTASAATLSLSPSSGSYSVGDSFSLSVVASSADQAINAVSGTINFPGNLLQVVSISKSNSILTLWVQEPSYSNTSGTVDFAGVVPNPGFAGAGGNLITIRFRAKALGTVALSITPAETLANDGSGTNILKGVSGATLTIGAAKVKPPTPSAPLPIPKKEEVPVPVAEVPTEFQAPIISSASKNVGPGKTAEVIGSSIYPDAIARLTLQGSSGPALTLESMVATNGVFSIIQVHNLLPGDYRGSVVILKDGRQSPASEEFLIRFENTSILTGVSEFVTKSLFLCLLGILLAFILGCICGYYYARSRRPVKAHDTPNPNVIIVKDLRSEKK